ncbi:hypothetical protein IFM89_018096 [Coptis chinensis]|uniref:FAS1 domain-containing protein n=1 Tax=Coptis chinensis TaxID=261450 RepID=A0A835ID23_9MAGN|nr:hypothetical protein IFM89_018096 [Coptis chinensis]
MASTFQLYLLLLLFLSTFSVSPVEGVTSSDHNNREINKKIVKAISDGGYSAMSLTLEMTLPTLISSTLSNNNATAVTIFCPVDEAFFSLKYPQPPLTLLEYHISPMKIEKDDLMSRLPLGSKIDTLLHGHPLVVSTLTHAQTASINNVKIKHWDIYNDGHVIVHGVESFFDPAFQTILYPWYDENRSRNSSSYGGSSDAGIISYIVLRRKLILNIAIFSAATWCLVEFVRRCWLLSHRRKAGYVGLDLSSDNEVFPYVR